MDEGQRFIDVKLSKTKKIRIIDFGHYKVDKFNEKCLLIGMKKKMTSTNINEDWIKEFTISISRAKIQKILTFILRTGGYKFTEEEAIKSGFRGKRKGKSEIRE